MRALLLAAGMTLATAPALAADPIDGEWVTQSGSGKVKMGACGNDAARLCGAISWLKNPADAAAKDTHNPDPKLQGRTILGLPMLWGFKQAGAGRWTGGKIYDPGSGKTYDSKLTVQSNGTLKVEGCILVVCQAQTWKRG